MERKEGRRSEEKGKEEEVISLITAWEVRPFLWSGEWGGSLSVTYSKPPTYK